MLSTGLGHYVTKVNKPKPMTREQFIEAVVRDQEKRRLSR